jgi:general secretion pathway protein E
MDALLDTMVTRPRPRFEDLLLERGSLAQGGLQTALARQQETGGRLWQILLGMGLATDEEILAAASQSLGVPWLSLADSSLNLHRATGAFPLHFLQEYRVFPLKIADGVLSVVMSDPTDLDTIDSIRYQSGCEVQVHLGVEREILKALEDYYGASSSIDRIVQDISEEGEAAEEGREDIAQLKDMAAEAPVIRLVNLLIAKAAEARASDIHIEPFEKSLRVRYRVDGVLQDTDSPPKRLQPAIISRVKVLARINIAERRLPQDGRIRMDVAGKDFDIRVSTIPTIYGESVVLRLLDRSSTLPELPELGFSGEEQRRFEELIQRPHGILLVTGPTGSGKTTTLYAALRQLNTVARKIITVEDPVEYQLEGVNQIQVKPQIGLTFAAGLRHIVRQDPDVILVGEIRDKETAEIAIQAALTGHLVLSTLHTNDAAGAITRLLDMGIEDYLVSSTLLAVLAQRLVRKICTECKTAYAPTEEMRREIKAPSNGLDGKSFFRGTGCAACGGTGYFGRRGIYELLVLDEGLQRLVLQKTDANTIRGEAIKRGMKTLRHDGWERVVAGQTTYEEVVRVTQVESEG